MVVMCQYDAMTTCCVAALASVDALACRKTYLVDYHVNYFVNYLVDCIMPQTVIHAGRPDVVCTGKILLLKSEQQQAAYLYKGQGSDHEGIVHSFCLVHFNMGCGCIDLQTDPTIAAVQGAVQYCVFGLGLLIALAEQSSQQSTAWKLFFFISCLG